MHPGRRVPSRRIDRAMQTHSQKSLDNPDSRSDVVTQSYKNNEQVSAQQGRDTNLRTPSDIPTPQCTHGDSDRNESTTRVEWEWAQNVQDATSKKSIHGSQIRDRAHTTHSSSNKLTIASGVDNPIKSVNQQGDYRSRPTTERSSRERASSAAPSISTETHREGEHTGNLRTNKSDIGHDKSSSKFRKYVSDELGDHTGAERNRSKLGPSRANNTLQSTQSEANHGLSRVLQKPDSGETSKPRAIKKTSSKNILALKGSQSDKPKRKESKKTSATNWLKYVGVGQTKPKGRNTQEPARSSSLSDLRLPSMERRRSGLHLYVPQGTHDDRYNGHNHGRHIVFEDEVAPPGLRTANSDSELSRHNDLNGDISNVNANVNMRNGFGSENSNSSAQREATKNNLRDWFGSENSGSSIHRKKLNKNIRDGFGSENSGSSRRRRFHISDNLSSENSSSNTKSSKRIPLSFRTRIKRSLSSNAMSNLHEYSAESIMGNTPDLAATNTLRSMYKEKEIIYMDIPQMPENARSASSYNIVPNPVKQEIEVYKTTATSPFGAEVVEVNGHYIVMRVNEFEDNAGTQSSAYRMGLSWGDKIVSYNGHPVKGYSHIQQILDSTKHIRLETYGQPWIMRYTGVVCPDGGIIGLTFNGRKVVKVNTTRGAYWRGVCEGYALLSANERCLLGLTDDIIDGIMTKMCAKNTKVDLMFMKDNVWVMMHQSIKKLLKAKHLGTTVAAYVGASLRLDRRANDTGDIEVVQIEDPKAGSKKKDKLASSSSKKKLTLG